MIRLITRNIVCADIHYDYNKLILAYTQGGDNLDHKFIIISHIEKRSDAFEIQPLSVEDEYNDMQTVRAYFILYRG